MTGLRALVRLAHRDARRDRWRTLLVVALVALPVAGLGGGIAFLDTVAPSAEERVRDMMGDADALAYPNVLTSPDDLVADLTGRLPTGTAVEARSDAGDATAIGGQRFAFGLSDEVQVEDRLGARFRLVEGRAPQAADEVAPTAALAEVLGVGVGDRLRFEGRGDVEVVGVSRRSESLNERTALVAPGTIDDPYSLDVLIDLPEGTDPSVVVGLSDDPGDGSPVWWSYQRDVELATRLSDGQRWAATVIGGLAAVEVALIAGAAFAVSVRRRQRELGLLAAVGGTRRHVRRVVLLTGVTSGVVGALIGTVIGVIGVLALSPWYDAIANREVAGVRLDPWWFAGAAVIGVASAALGAWWPARSVAALPVTVALSGRRPTPEPSVRSLRAGVVIVAVGGAMTVLGSLLTDAAVGTWIFLAGAVLLVLGAGLTSPWLLEQAARLAPRLSAGPRLALRDAARFRTRNGPIVTAAMAGLAASISIATVIGSMDAAESAAYRPSLPTDLIVVQAGDDAAGRAVAAATDGAMVTIESAGLDVRPGAGAGGDDELWGWPAVGTPELAAALGGDDAVAALADGHVVLFGQTVSEIELWRWDATSLGSDGSDPEEVEELVATASTVRLPIPGDVEPMLAAFPTVLVPPELAEPEDVVSSQALVTLPGPIDEAIYERAVAAAAAVPGNDVGFGSEAFVQAERGYRSTMATTLLVVLVLGAVAGLLVVGVAVALAAAEARSDLRTLTAVGASSRTRRSLAAGRAALLAGIGGVLAVPVGLVPGAAVVGQIADVPFAVPWVAILTATVIVPGLATLGAVVASRRTPLPSLRAVA